MAFNKEKVMDAARKFVDKGQIDKAVKEYLRIVQEDPKDVRVWLKIGDLYAKKGAKQDATETYLKVARFYHEQGFFLKAVAVYKQILKLDPRLVDVILKLAELYRQLGLMSDAMQHYESVAAHFHREGNTKEALDTVKKLVDLDPENIATRIKLAELYSKESLVDEAVLQFNMACEQLRRQGRQDDFIKVAERLLWHKPDNHALNRELAGLYLRRNDPRRALQKLQVCFKADPRDAETLGLLALAFQALDQKAKTVSVLKELARIHVENKARLKADEVYRKILEIVPNDPDALQHLGPQAAAAAAAPQPQPAAPPPSPPARNTPPPPPIQRGGTPLPAAVRQATNAAKFNLTTDLPALDIPPPGSRMTGAMPLVDEQSLSGVDFALPEYDDADFSADMEPPPDPRRQSAAGERHAEEISKILAETDVYVKYGLHQKAVDHLRRVFTLDGDNVEAHERLKDIFISQGREQEAEVELLKLAELIAPSDPDRAEQYLQELLAMNGTHTGAFELARKFQLRVARMSSVSAEVEYSGGGVAEVDPDMDDLELSAAPPAAMGVARGGHRDSIEELDLDDLGGRNIAHGSPAPGRPPRPPQYDNGGFEVELDSVVGADAFSAAAHSTRQVPGDELNALVQQASYEEEDSAVLVDRPPPGGWDGHQYPPTTYEGQQAYSRSLEDSVAQQLDDDALGQDIDQEVAAELGHSRGEHGEDMPFDPHDAREFDRGFNGAKGETDAVYVSGFEATELPPPEYGDGDQVAGYDPYGTESVQANYDATVMGGPIVDDVDTPAVGGRAESLVEDDLEEVNFYSDQGMYAEAIESLRGLFDRYPNHPLLTAKLRELEALEAGIEPVLHTPPAGGQAAPHAHTGADSTGTEALDLDEIEEVSADDMLEEVEPGESGGVRTGGKRKPTVMLEKPVDESDADTHYDLGLAYKEMGLYDEAIKAFEKVIRAPGREVQCRVMIGMCHREMNNPQEAIQEFKQGLHANASDRERLSLYYEIGITYESIGDLSEALYYYESVLKRDPKFADVPQRAESIRQRGTRPSQRIDDDL